MLFEIAAALALGGLVLWLVFQPMLASGQPDLTLLEPDAPEETRRGVALLALKEIEFDRETGKLSERDYESLKARYGAEALAAIADDERSPPHDSGTEPVDAERLIATRLQAFRSAPDSDPQVSSSPSCLRCGPRPEPDARFCSRCGLALFPATYCAECGAVLPNESRFCARCGHKVAA